MLLRQYQPFPSNCSATDEPIDADPWATPSGRTRASVTHRDQESPEDPCLYPVLARSLWPSQKSRTAPDQKFPQMLDRSESQPPYELAPPFAGALVESLRGVGYSRRQRWLI